MKKQLISTAQQAGQAIIEALRNSGRVGRISLAGTVRRHLPMIDGIDIVAACDEPEAVHEFFRRLSRVSAVSGDGKSVIRALWDSKIRVELRLVNEPEYPFCLLYRTGSPSHVETLREKARQRGCELDEAGLCREGEKLVCPEEADIYRHLGFPAIPPELREGRGEIAAAGEGRFSDLIRPEDIRGMIHVHSNWSDGDDSLEMLLREALILGYQYIGISDHSQSAHYAGGLSESDIECQHAEIDRLQRSFPGIRILRSIECDILDDGSLDYDDGVLASFDFVIGSIHSGLHMDESSMTARILRAFENPRIHIFAHPTGRLMPSIEGYAVDLDAVIEGALRHGVVMEISANPQRLDLNWEWGRLAAERGVYFSINPDAHCIGDFRDMIHGVQAARKCWLTRDRIINTGSVDEFLQFCKGKE